NALRIAQALNDHPAVKKVYYPGLPTHPQHELAKRQQSGFGAMLSFELRGGIPNVCAFLEGLKAFSLAESLGGVESLVAHPASMTHAAMDAEAQRAAGISETLLRISVGIEAVEDLLQDLREGLDRATAVQ
ncbi:MAG TPA: PLP-dependent transferase, partial [Nitrospiraceae bacterium]|nr:PLP-dependent transferase [Nitrospiraceae bacterium]